MAILHIPDSLQSEMESANETMQNKHYSPLDEDYFNEIEQYRGNEYYYNMLKNNPYLLGENRWEPNLWQSIGMAFGDDSAQVNFLNNLRQQRTDYMNRILEAMHKEDYQDPVNEVARRRAAGINDDLSGGSQIGSGEPGDINQPDNAASVQNDYSSSIQSIAQAGVTLMQTAFSIYSGLQGVRSAFLDNESKELLLSSNFQESAWNILGDSISEYMHQNPSKLSDIEDISDPSFVPITASVIRSFAGRVNSMPFTNRQKRKIMSFIDELPYTKDSNGNKVYTARYQSLWNDKLISLRKSRNELAQVSGLPGADKEDQEAIKFIGENVYKPINNLQLEFARQEAKFNSSYYKQANENNVPALQADSEAVQLMFAKDMNNMKLKVTSAFEEINKKITGNKKISENWKMALQVGTSVAESLILTNMNNMPHLNIGLRNGVHDTRTTTVQMR